MAQQRRSGSGKGIPHHPLVEALASDPSKPPENATKLFGFPGPAADEKSTRLWLDTDLTTYVDVPNEAIVHSQTLENDGGTFLWVDPAATLTHCTSQSQEVQAEFLGGAIAAANLGAAGPNPIPMVMLEAAPTSTYDSQCPMPQSATEEECHTWKGCMSREWICRPEETADFPCPRRTVDPPCDPSGSGEPTGSGEPPGRAGSQPDEVGGNEGMVARPWRPWIFGREPSYLVVCPTPDTGCPRLIPTPWRISVGIHCP